MCCACSGVCNHVGPHAYCMAHGGTIGQWVTPNTISYFIPQPQSVCQICGAIVGDWVKHLAWHGPVTTAAVGETP